MLVVLLCVLYQFIVQSLSRPGIEGKEERPYGRDLSIPVTPGLDNTRLFISLTAVAGTRCISFLS